MTPPIRDPQPRSPNAGRLAAVLEMDPAAEARRIIDTVRQHVFRQLRRKGVVIALSGGVDSSVAAALCVRALGPRRVLGLFMPERDSSPESLALGCMLAERLAVPTAFEQITGILEAAGCYRRRDEAIRTVLPQYGPGYQSKIVLPHLLRGGYRIFSVVIRSPTGEIHRRRLSPEAYQGVLAATSFKQRTRKMIEYYHADRLRYAVVGTPNRLEFELGFFVKNGDGAADLKPIAHLYKTQVYRLAEYLGVPDAIRTRPPTTDTYSFEQSQEESFFSLPHETLDVCLHGKDHQVPCDEVAPAVGLTVEQAERVYRDIDAKRRAARYLHAAPLLVSLEV